MQLPNLASFDRRDQVVLVDEHDVMVGTMNKYVAHQNPPKLHRAVSVWLVNSRGEFLFQQRSQFKFTGQGWWANTICGNVFPDETYEACAYRRLEEELGITEVKVTEVYTFRYWTYVNETYGEHEMDRVFVGKYDGEVHPNPREASDFRWFSRDELLQSKLSTQKYITAEESLALPWSELAKHTPPVEVQLSGQTYQVVPWSIMMWQDKRLQNALEKLLTS